MLMLHVVSDLFFTEKTMSEWIAARTLKKHKQKGNVDVMLAYNVTIYTKYTD